MDRIRIGIIGVKGIGSVYMNVVRAISDARLVAVTGPQDAYPRVSERDVRFFDDALEMLEETRLDAVIITRQHGEELVKEALERKIPVLKEPPLAYPVEVAENLVEVARENKVTLMVSTPRRYTTMFQHAKRIIDENVVGGVLMARGCGIVDSTRFRVEGDFDPLVSTVYGMLDLYLWFFGKPLKIYSSCIGEQGLLSGCKKGLFNLHFQNDVIGSLVFGYSAGMQEENIVVYFEKGTMLASWNELHVQNSAGSIITRELKIGRYFQDALRLQVERFIRIVQTRNRGERDLKEALNMVKILDLALKSCREGREVAIP